MTRRRNSTVRTRTARLAMGAVTLAAVGAVLVGAWATAGCAEPLDSRRFGRTQFDPHDRARDQLEPETLTDEFGRPVPNLRGRLLRPEDL